MTDYRAAADALDNLAELVEAATADRDLTPAEVAAQAGVKASSLMRFVVDGTNPSLSTAAKLLRWLANP